MSIKVGILGATGRMGAHLIKNVSEDGALELAAVHVYDELTQPLPKEVLVTNSIRALLEASDVIIDFSAPAATQALCEEAMAIPRGLVIATTGLSQHQKNLIEEAARLMPVLYASNMSAGIALLKQLVERSRRH